MSQERLNAAFKDTEGLTQCVDDIQTRGVDSKDHDVNLLRLLDTVAHNCHGNNKYLTAKPKVSRQNQIAHGKTKKLTAKPKSSRQNKKLTAKDKSSRQKKKAHGKSKRLTAKAKSSRQKEKAHGKSKRLTAKAKSSRQNKNLTAKPKRHKERMQGLAGRTSVLVWSKHIETFIEEANLHRPTIKFTAEISDTEIVFLDTIIYKGTRFHEKSILDVKTF